MEAKEKRKTKKECKAHLWIKLILLLIIVIAGFLFWLDRRIVFLYKVGKVMLWTLYVHEQDIQKIIEELHRLAPYL